MFLGLSIKFFLIFKLLFLRDDSNLLVVSSTRKIGIGNKDFKSFKIYKTKNFSGYSR